MAKETEDRDLITSFLETKEENVFRQIYRRFTPRLFLFALRLCGGDHSKAEDVVQETWIRVVQNLSKFVWRSAFSSWLSGIAFNCYREQRKMREEVWQFDIEIPEKPRDWNTSLDLELLIHRLPDGCREIFILHDIEGYTHEEIANFLNIEDGTSKSQLFQARKKLRQWLSPKEFHHTREESK